MQQVIQFGQAQPTTLQQLEHAVKSTVKSPDWSVTFGLLVRSVRTLSPSRSDCRALLGRVKLFVQAAAVVIFCFSFMFFAAIIGG